MRLEIEQQDQLPARSQMNRLIRQLQSINADAIGFMTTPFPDFTEQVAMHTAATSLRKFNR